MLTNLITWMLKRRKFVLFSHVLIGVVSIYFAAQVKFDFNFQDYFPKNDPARDEYVQMLQDFPSEVSEFVLVIEEDSLFHYEHLRALSRLSQDLKRSGLFSSVYSLASLPPGMFGSFGINYQRIIAGEKLSPGTYGSFRERALASPILNGQLLFNEGQVLAIRCVSSPENANDEGREKIKVMLEELIRNYSPGFDGLFFTGFSGVRADYATLLKKQQALLFPILILVLLIVLLGFIGRGPLFFLPLGVSILAVITAVALMVLGGAPFTILSSGTPLLILIIGLSDFMHVFYHLDAALLRGEPKEKAIVHTFQFLGKSCLLTSLTTMAGFLALLFVNVPVLREFGWYTALGILLNYIFLMTLLPAILIYIREKHLLLRPAGLLEKALEASIEGIIRIFQRPRKWLPVFSLLFLLVMLGIIWVDEDTRIYQDLAPRNELRKKIDKAERLLGGVLPTGLVYQAESEVALFSINTIRQLDTVQAFLSRQEGVGSSFSVVNLLKQYYGSAKSFDEVAAGRLEADLRRLSKENSELVKSILNTGKNRVLIRARVEDMGAKKLRAFAGRLNHFLSETGHAGQWTTAGLPSLSLRLSRMVVRSMLVTISIACAVIFVGFLIGSRSLKMAVVGIIPNLVPLLTIGGFLGWMGVSLQPSIAIVFCIVYGIAVNDTIHFIHRYLAGEPGPAGHRIISTIRISGKALITSSIVLICGFSVLLFSEFLGLFYLGLLLIVGILSALLGDLILLPILLSLTSKKES